MSEYGHGGTYRITLANVSDWRRALLDFRHQHPNIKLRTSLDNGRVPMLLRATGQARIEARVPVESDRWTGWPDVPVDILLVLAGPGEECEGGREEGCDALDG